MAKVTVSSGSVASPVLAPSGQQAERPLTAAERQELDMLRAKVKQQAEAQQAGIRVRVNAKGQPTGRHGAIGKGTISVFGISGTGRFGVTYYPRGWVNLLDSLQSSGPLADAIRGALRDHAAVLDFGNQQGD